MQKREGKEETRAIRALEVDTHTTIVALTAHAMEGDGRAIMAVGLDHYMTKPLNKGLLLERIEAAHTEGMLPLEAPQADG